uniref:J domain-containing protein n=1 Tax=Trichocoleus desertorum TaxID=1481672 RepID=UPI0025B34634
MTQDGATPHQANSGVPPLKSAAPNYYALLGLHPSASPQQIRRAYRELSKVLHPDTTTLPPAIATAKFQQLNEAYAVVSNPERRLAYDRKIGYSRLHVMQAPADLNGPVSQSRRYSSSAYLDPTDRPLSPGEIFALFILGVTFVACLVLAIAIGLTRGDAAFQPLKLQTQTAPIERIEGVRSEQVAPSAKALDSDANQKFAADFVSKPKLIPPV